MGFGLSRLSLVVNLFSTLDTFLFLKLLHTDWPDVQMGKIARFKFPSQALLIYSTISYF